MRAKILGPLAPGSTALDPIYVNAPLVHSVFHPTDLSEASDTAFAHALSVALIRNTSLTILHVGQAFVGSWSELPQVRETLRRWKLLEGRGARSEAYGRFQVRVEKINVGFGTALRTTLRHLENKPTDLIVLATHGREGVPRWIRPSVAERLARR